VRSVWGRLDRRYPISRTGTLRRGPQCVSDVGLEVCTPSKKGLTFDTVDEEMDLARCSAEELEERDFG
jgi:hypothetical protein